ncbi:unnamed protein product [Cuscuta epithymum]|nr:unnamed protein product [Cuscuta epithymum]
MSVEVLVNDVKPNTYQWTCRLTLIEKQNIRTAKTSPMKFMPMILQDSTGTKVQATAFQGDIEGIDQRLSVYSTYLISNAYVKPVTQMRYCIDVNYPYVWSFNRRTLIQDVDAPEGVDFREIAESETAAFRDIFDSYQHATRINILGAIVKKLPRTFIVSDGKQRTAWDVVVINEECIPLPFTMWEEFVSKHGGEIEKLLNSGGYPLVLINRVAINLFQGLALSTRYDCHMELNPDGARALSLKKWVDGNAIKIATLVQDKAYNDALSIISKPLAQPRSTLSGLETGLLEVIVVWVLGKFSLVDTSQEFFYIGCNYCNRRVYGPEGITFQCLFCGQKLGTTTKRFRLDAYLTDSTASIAVTLFTNDILAFFKYACMDPNVATNLEDFDAKLQTLNIVAGIKHSKPNEEGIQTNPHTVVFVSQELPTLAASPPITSPPPLSSYATSSQAKRKLDFESPTDLPPECSAISTLPVHHEAETEESLGNLRGKRTKDGNT